jgi:hypothetical protein
VEFVLDADVRDHLAADFAEPAQAVGDLDETILVFGGDVAGDVPAVLECLRRQVRPAQVTFHDVRASHQQEPGSLTGRGSKVAGSTIRTLMPGRG